MFRLFSKYTHPSNPNPSISVTASDNPAIANTRTILTFRSPIPIFAGEKQQFSSVKHHVESAQYPNCIFGETLGGTTAIVLFFPYAFGDAGYAHRDNGILLPRFYDFVPSTNTNATTVVFDETRFEERRPHTRGTRC